LALGSGSTQSLALRSSLTRPGSDRRRRRAGTRPKPPGCRPKGRDDYVRAIVSGRQKRSAAAGHMLGSRELVHLGTRASRPRFPFFGFETSTRSSSSMRTARTAAAGEQRRLDVHYHGALPRSSGSDGADDRGSLLSVYSSSNLSPPGVVKNVLIGEFLGRSATGDVERDAPRRADLCATPPIARNTLRRERRPSVLLPVERSDPAAIPGT